MNEEAYTEFITLIREYILMSDGDDNGLQVKAIVSVLCKPAENVDFRRALIDTAKDKKFDEHYRSVALKCLSDLAPNHNDARVALEDVAKNDPNDRLRKEAADALKSLETQATIDPSNLRQLGGLQL